MKKSEYVLIKIYTFNQFNEKSTYLNKKWILNLNIFDLKFSPKLPINKIWNTQILDINFWERALTFGAQCFCPAAANVEWYLD